MVHRWFLSHFLNKQILVCVGKRLVKSLFIILRPNFLKRFCLRYSLFVHFGAILIEAATLRSCILTFLLRTKFQIQMTCLNGAANRPRKNRLRRLFSSHTCQPNWIGNVSATQLLQLNLVAIGTYEGNVIHFYTKFPRVVAGYLVSLSQDNYLF